MVCKDLADEAARWASKTTSYLLLRKKKYDPSTKQFFEVPLEGNTTGVARMGKYKARGAERAAFRCTEVSWERKGNPSTIVVQAEGPRLIAKETLHEEKMPDATFHEKMCELQSQATLYANVFNRNIEQCIGHRKASCQVTFVECHIYELADPAYEHGKVGVCQGWVALPYGGVDPSGSSPIKVIIA